jgi:hypothetical protein
MPQRVVYLLFLFIALLTSGSCTNDETDEGLEVLTPNDPAETSISRSQLEGRDAVQPAAKDPKSIVLTKS